MHNDIKGNKHNNTKDNTKQTQHNKMEIARPQTRQKKQECKHTQIKQSDRRGNERNTQTKQQQHKTSKQ